MTTYDRSKESRTTIMGTTAPEFLTVTEAAELLRVSVTTIRRWIRDGSLVAHRAGRRRVLLKRTEVIASLQSFGNQEGLPDNGDPRRARVSMAVPGDLGDGSDSFDLGDVASLIEHSPDRPVHRRLTREEVKQAMMALKRAEEFSAKLSARYGGILFPPSEEIIREMRAERTRQLTGEDDTDLPLAT